MDGPDAWLSPDAWSTRTDGPAPAFEDAFASYSSQTDPRPRSQTGAQTGAHVAAHLGVLVPAHARLPVIELEPDPWPTVTFSQDPRADEQPAWEQPYDDRDRRVASHRRTPQPRGRRLHPVAFGVLGMVAGLALSLAVLSVVLGVLPT